MRTELRCRGWQQEAALRMLENNLHPDVAEKPEELVVYGGIGKAARDQASLAAIKRELMRARATTRRCSCSPASRSRVFETHEARAARADRQLQPRRRLGDLGDVPRARRGRADDVRPDDGGVVDLHRHPGHPAGHLRDVRRGRAQALRRRRCAGRLVVTAGLGGHGRRAAARRHDERAARRCASRSTCTRIERRIATGYLDERAGRPRRRARPRCAARRRRARPLSIGLLGNAAEVLPELARRGVARRRRDRPDLARTTRSTATSRPG